MARGALSPDFFATEDLGQALTYTMAFALIGVAFGSIFGFIFSMAFHYRFVRVACAFARSIHELFWALIFLQVFGLNTLTGILAIAIPYTGIFAKVYSEIMEETDASPLKVIPDGSGRISTLFFATLPNAWIKMKTYTMYRLECGIRSSAVLGFVGLPTLGYHLESAFAQGRFSEVAALLFIFYIIIASMRLWMRPRLLPLYIAVSFLMLPGGSDLSWTNIVRFFTEDIIPLPLRHSWDAATLGDLAEWIKNLLINQAVPGVINTVLLTMIALVATGMLTLLFFPLISSRFFGRFGRTGGHAALVVMRSTPEYILAFIFLQMWGPSMLPAIIALALHNGAIIGHLIGRNTETLTLRPDSPKGVNLYFYEVLPRVYRPFLAFLFYRWEVIMRETGILGILGIKTLGFYIDSSFADIRFDRAAFLIIITALLNMAIDAISHTIRKRLSLASMPGYK